MVANKKRGDFIPINDDEELQKLIKKKAVQLCPFCKTPGTKVSGCSYIVCPNSKCGKAWTWQGNIIENLLGATHH
jgi:hypothetical protein